MFLKVKYPLELPLHTDITILFLEVMMLCLKFILIQRRQKKKRKPVLGTGFTASFTENLSADNLAEYEQT